MLWHPQSGAGEFLLCLYAAPGFRRDDATRLLMKFGIQGVDFDGSSGLTFVD